MDPDQTPRCFSIYILKFVSNIANHLQQKTSARRHFQMHCFWLELFMPNGIAQPTAVKNPSHSIDAREI